MTINPELGLRRLGSWGEKARALVAGDVRDVLSGQVGDGKLTALEPGRYLGGLGAASPAGAQETGELVIAGGKAWIQPPAQGRPSLAVDAPQSPFAALLPQGALPAELLEAAPDQPAPAAQMVAAVSEGRRLTAFAGWLELAKLHTTFLAKPPTAGEPVTQTPGYMEPAPVEDGRLCVVFGLAADYRQAPGPGHDPALEERLFYVNPNDPTADPRRPSHAHVLVLPQGGPPASGDPEELTAWLGRAETGDARHLLGQSLVSRGMLMVYDLESLASL
jgi:hypothetical protein